MKSGNKYFAIVLSILLSVSGVGSALGQQVECTGKADRVTALTNPNGHLITTKFQFDTPNLQTYLSHG